jgi:FixJ family two-component response regulator
MSAAPPGNEIFIVDDDPSLRDTLQLAFTSAGFQVTSFAEGISLLAAARSRVPACIILDVYMPGPSGLEVLQELGIQYPAPIIMISGQCTVPMVVDMLKSGAHDVIEKPFEAGILVARVNQAIKFWARRGRHEPVPDMRGLQFPGRDRLTPREREVLARIAAGGSSKEIARDLDTSARTIEVHRAHIMRKLGAKNAADLVRIVLGWRGDEQVSG